MMTRAPTSSRYGPTFDCEPTLNDEQVLDFCRQGYLVLERVVEEEVNNRMMAFIDDPSPPSAAGNTG